MYWYHMSYVHCIEDWLWIFFWICISNALCMNVQGRAQGYCPVRDRM